MRCRATLISMLFAHCAITSSAFAEESTPHIRIAPEWKVGERVRLQFDRVRETHVPDAESRIVHSRVPVDIEVLEVREEGFLLNVRFGKTAFIPPDPASEEIVNRFDPVPQRILLSRDGTILALENWKEVREQAVAMVRSANTGTEEEKAEFNAIVERVIKMYATQEQATAAFTMDIAGYFMPIGIDLTPNQPVLETQSIPNPTGDDPFPGKSRIMAHYDPNNKRHIIVDWDFRYGDSIGEAALDMARELSGKKDAMKGEPLPAFEVQDETHAVYDSDRGWVVDGAYTRTVVTGEVKKFDRRIWKLMPSNEAGR